MKTTRSEKLFKEACELIPGGVNSPVRACLGVGADPLFIASAKGSHVITVDGQEMIDFVESWGPMLLGHSHPEVTKAVVEAAGKGTSYGAPCPAEVELARMVVDAFPGMDMVRMVNSGTEATMSALRLARGVTGRTKVLKFIGCYHGHADPFLASAGSGVATLSIPGTPGVPESTVRDTLLAPYNDVRAVEDIFHLYGKDIAAIIVEPIAGNMGLVLPEEGFLKALRALCDTHGALLIMDEVITGFRAEYGGAQTRFGITPDLTTLGKIIGGGLPVAAYGGRKDIMDCVSPAGPVYQAGTLSGNPLAMAAGLETLRIITEDPDYVEKACAKTKILTDGLKAAADEAGAAVQVHRAGTMFSVFFSAVPVTNYATSEASDQEAFQRYFLSMLEQGIYLAPSQFETNFVSGVHSDEDIEKTITAARTAFEKAVVRG